MVKILITTIQVNFCAASQNLPELSFVIWVIVIHLPELSFKFKLWDFFNLCFFSLLQEEEKMK